MSTSNVTDVAPPSRSEPASQSFFLYFRALGFLEEHFLLQPGALFWSNQQVSSTGPYPGQMCCRRDGCVV